jgi:membrane dipeptidase
MQTRKQFLRDSLTLLSGVALLGSKSLYAGTHLNSSPGILFDLHAHPGQLFYSDDGNLTANPNALRVIGEMNTIHLGGVFFSLVADAKIIARGPNGILVNEKYKKGEGWSEYKRQLNVMKKFLEQSPARLATSARDVNDSGKVAAFLSVEGGDFLDGNSEKLDDAYADGIRSVQIVHYAPNELGDLQTADTMFNGLSAKGKSVVRKMNQLGMLIDAAHASYDTVKSVADLTASPIMLSHSVLQMEPDRPIAKRAISKEHAKVVSGTGGIIGMWPSGFNLSFDEFVDNTLRMVDVVGIDHVGLGTDMDANFKPVLSSYSELPTFSKALKDKGMSSTEVDKIMGGNAVRVLKQVLK